MTFEFLGILTSFFDFLWSSFLLLAPMLLLGLFLSGLIHVFISRQAIQAILRRRQSKIRNHKFGHRRARAAV